MSNIDNITHLFVELCYKKIEKFIDVNTDTVAGSKSPIKAVYQNCKWWKRFTKTTINPTTRVVYDKLAEYCVKNNKNAEKYVLKQRSHARYLIIKTWLKIKYTMWILFWYVRN